MTNIPRRSTRWLCPPDMGWKMFEFESLYIAMFVFLYVCTSYTCLSCLYVCLLDQLEPGQGWWRCAPGRRCPTRPASPPPRGTSACKTYKCFFWRKYNFFYKIWIRHSDKSKVPIYPLFLLFSTQLADLFKTPELSLFCRCNLWDGRLRICAGDRSGIHFHPILPLSS